MAEQIYPIWCTAVVFCKYNSGVQRCPDTKYWPRLLHWNLTPRIENVNYILTVQSRITNVNTPLWETYLFRVFYLYELFIDCRPAYNGFCPLQVVISSRSKGERAQFQISLGCPPIQRHCFVLLISSLETRVFKQLL